MPRLVVEGCVIVSADGNLADARGQMPSALIFPGDQRFFADRLDDADLIVHGRNSYEDQPQSPLRRRLVLTRRIGALEREPANERAFLWNPAGASFDEACAFAGVTSGSVVVIGGPDIFSMFLDRYDRFWLSVAPRVHLPNGKPAFSGYPGRPPQDILTLHGLTAGETHLLDADEDVTVTEYRRA